MDNQPQKPETLEDDNRIDMEELISEWGIAKQYVDNHTSDFQALDNLVDAVPVSHQPGAPYVGDTTLAGLVRSIPRDSLQQLPIFAAKVNGSKTSIDAHIGSFVLRRGVFNEDTFGKGLLSTLQVGAEQALTHGYAAFMTAIGQMYDEFGTTMRVLHYADVAPEPGIQDGHESGYWYVRANLTKSRVRKILKAARANPNTSWKVECLEKLLEMNPVTQDYSIYMSDPRHQAAAESAPTYEFIVKYDVGRGGEFITFCPQYTESELRVIKNKSKFGYPRVQLLVIDPNALTPFGVSRVRLASPSQNLMNAYYQNITSMLILNSKPPILKRGRFTKPIRLKQGEVWEALDQNAKAELVTMDNGALEQFVPMAKQMTAQIETMMGKPNKARSVGNTAPGVKEQIKDEDTSTNQITNILENFLRQYALVALDVYISEQTVENYDPENPIEDTLILDDEAKEAINEAGRNAFVPTPEVPEYLPIVGDDNEMTVDWNKYYANIKTLGVEIELSMGKDELEEKKRGDLQDMLTVMSQTADPNDMEAQEMIKTLRNKFLNKTMPEMRIKPSSPPSPMTPPAAEPTAETVGADQTAVNVPV